MEEQKFSFSEVFDKSKEYLETQIELAKLKALSRSSRIVGSLIVDGSKVLLSLLIVFFISLALGFYLGELLGSYSLGFLATGGIFFVILLLIRVFEPKLEEKFMNVTIKRIMSKWDADDDDELDEEEIKEKVREAVEEVENEVVEEVKVEKERV
ncbi:hypothetical protein [Sphingobacterium sp. 1.A.5]|uniref:hypothetical protein n=1 Tax=Sphingobacterium sp. 1.A.5 TaxID=2044604 RepID=UPI0015D49216|nr:hypothetical protein [Sphingobacterium sp. 1.A.5]